MESSDSDLSRRKSGDSMKIKRTSSKGSMKSKKKDGKSSAKSEEYKEDLHSEEQIEMLTPKQNGYVGRGDVDTEETQRISNTASIKGMWKKAFKSLKSNDKQNWLSKKGSLIKRKEEEPEEEPQETSKEIDPVYSLLKCAADLPKVPKNPKESQCAGHLGGKGDSSGSTSKASSPSSSATVAGGAGGSVDGSCGTGSGGRSPQPQSPTRTSHPPFTATPSQDGGSPTGTSTTTSSSSSSSVTNRDHMHHIVDESLGSEFRTFYKLTSPVRKLQTQHSHYGSSKKHSSDQNFDQY